MSFKIDRDIPADDAHHEPDLSSQKDEKDFLHEEKLGLWHYAVQTPDREMVLKWKADVDVILAALRHGIDLREFVPRNGEKISKREEKRLVVLDDILKNENGDENLDEEDLTLMAIGIFILNNKGKYSNLWSNLKGARGGTFPLEDVFAQDKYFTCIDLGSVVKVLAEEYGIEGDIVGPRRVGHRYFRSKNRKVVDFIWPERAGLFQDEQKFFEHIKKLPLFLRMQIFGLFPYSSESH